MKSRRSKRTIQELVDEIARSTIEQDRQIELGNARTGNVAARRGIKAFKELRDNYGDTGREALTSLFEHQYEGARVGAAALLLRYCTDRALAVLRGVAENGKGFAQMDAFYSIKNWEEGKWELDLSPEPINEGQENPEQQP